MKEIVHAHFGDIDKELLQQAVLTFFNIRRVQNLSKKPSTSELIDWLRALMAAGVDPASIPSALPYLGVLIKKDKDYAQVISSMRH
jgi:MoxR-like ATPase